MPPIEPQSEEVVERFWRSVPGSESLMDRLGWWPSFHDAELLLLQMRLASSGYELEVRVRLNEGGPRDVLSLVWAGVDVFSIPTYENVDTDQYWFYDSEVHLVDDRVFEMKIATERGDWLIRGTGLSVRDYEFGEEE